MQSLKLARWNIVVHNALVIMAGLGASIALLAAMGLDLPTAVPALVSPFFDFRRGVVDLLNLSEIFVRFVPLCVIALGIGIGIRANVWNVGGEGQFLLGSVFSFVAWLHLKGLPPPVHVVVMLAAGALGGMLWITVPAFMKARLGANEIITTLLFNFLGFNFFAWAIDQPIRGKASFGYPITDILPLELRIPNLQPGTRLSYSLFIAIVLVVIMYIVSERTSFGIQTRTVGKSHDVARYAGIGIGRTIMITMLISGALSGLAGSLHVSGAIFNMDGGYPANFGYIAIVIAMLGGAHSLGIMASGLVFSYIVIGAENLFRVAQVTSFIIFVIEGIVLLSLVMAEFFVKRGVRM